jgi:hypothetical protein
MMEESAMSNSPQSQSPNVRYVFDSIRDDVDERKLKVLWELLDEAPPSLERLPLSTEVAPQGLGILIAALLVALSLWSLVLLLQ